MIRQWYHGLKRAWSDQNELWVWRLAGRPVPPPHAFKRTVLKLYQRRYRLDTLVETGTYLGDMVDAMRGCFKRLYSIEVAPTLAQAARLRFSGDNAIEVLEGDSASVLPGLLRRPELAGARTLFWLDGHYSGGVTGQGSSQTPILEELRSIASAPPAQGVILIDDAHCFGEFKDYPGPQELQDELGRLFPGSAFHAAENIFRVVLRPGDGPGRSHRPS